LSGKQMWYGHVGKTVCYPCLVAWALEGHMSLYHSPDDLIQLLF